MGNMVDEDGAQESSAELKGRALPGYVVSR